MKKIYLLYGVAVFAVAVLLVDFISYAIHTPTVQKEVRNIQVETETSIQTKDTPPVKKKLCNCCTERRERLREFVQRTRERRQRENNTR